MRSFDPIQGDIVIPASKIKLAGLIAIGAGFGALGVWLLDVWSSQGQPFGLLPVIAALSLLMGLVGGGYALFRLLVRRPAVALTADGLYDNASAVAAGFVPWESIEAILVYRQQNQTFLGAVPKDIPGFLEARGRVKRLILRASLRLGSPPIAIPQGVLPMSARELAEQISARYPVRVLLD